jgi:hypothetical protein
MHALSVPSWPPHEQARIGAPDLLKPEPLVEGLRSGIGVKYLQRKVPTGVPRFSLKISDDLCANTLALKSWSNQQIAEEEAVGVFLCIQHSDICSVQLHNAQPQRIEILTKTSILERFIPSPDGSYLISQDSVVKLTEPLKVATCNCAKGIPGFWHWAQSRQGRSVLRLYAPGDRW